MTIGGARGGWAFDVCLSLLLPLRVDAACACLQHQQAEEEDEEKDEEEDEEDDGRDDIGSSYLPADDAGVMSGNEEEEEAYDEFWDEDEIVLPGEEGGEEAYKRRQRQRASVLKRYTVLQLLRLVRVLALQEPNNKVLVRAGVVGSVVEILAVVPRVKVSQGPRNCQ